MYKHTRTQKFLAEFAGTFCVVLVSAGAVVLVGGALGPITYLRGTQSVSVGPLGAAGLLGSVGPLGVALAYGVAYAVAVAKLGRISGGHFNPAVTIAHWVTHRFGPLDSLIYIAAQLAGASAAAYTLRFAALTVSTASTTQLGPPSLAAGMTRGPAMLMEASMTFLLVLAIWVTMVDRKRPRYWLGGLVAGAVIAAASFAGAPYTGGAMNPARAFGPALAARHWAYQGVYWVGPLAGAVVAACLCDLLFRRNMQGVKEVPQTTITDRN